MLEYRTGIACFAYRRPLIAPTCLRCRTNKGLKYRQASQAFKLDYGTARCQSNLSIGYSSGPVSAWFAVNRALCTFCIHSRLASIKTSCLLGISRVLLFPFPQQLQPQALPGFLILQRLSNTNLRGWLGENDLYSPKGRIMLKRTEPNSSESPGRRPATTTTSSKTALILRSSQTISL